MWKARRQHQSQRRGDGADPASHSLMNERRVLGTRRSFHLDGPLPGQWPLLNSIFCSVLLATAAPFFMAGLKR